MSRNRAVEILAAAVLTTLPLVAAAQDSPEKWAQRPTDMICPRGTALTWELQCDAGSRPAIERIWNPPGAGAEMCRVNLGPVCTAIPNFDPSSRVGFEVEDSKGAGQLGVMTFGLGRLMGAAP